MFASAQNGNFRPAYTVWLILAPLQKWAVCSSCWQYMWWPVFGRMSFKSTGSTFYKKFV